MTTDRSAYQCTPNNNGKKKSVCLVTNELYPFAPGGIGRLMYNWIKQNSELEVPVALHLLISEELNDKSVEIQEFCAQYEVECHFCNEDDLELTRLGRAIAPSIKQSWDYLHPYRVSYQYFVSLLRLERSGVVFDLIEFPDYGGWGAISIEAKRAGLAFVNTEICVRLHSSYGVIVSTERFYHHPSGYGGAMVDLERFALAYADRIIAHQKSILEFNLNFYKFTEDWRNKAIIETPPILLDEFELNDDEEPIKRFVFSSRLQPFKRPDMFLRAACLYYDQYPDDDSEALIVSYGWDDNYIASLIAIIPERHRERIKFCFGLQGASRQALLAGAIIVIPSDYESYCLFAYETALMKRRLLLRRDCLAFSEEEGWVDEVNCLHFDSDPASLAVAMRRALKWQPSCHRVTEASKPYWTQFGGVSKNEYLTYRRLSHEFYLLNVVSSDQVVRAVDLCLRSSVNKIVVFVGSHGNAQEIEVALSGSNISYQVVTSPYGDNYFDPIWRKLCAAESDLVTISHASDVVDPLYLDVAARALSSKAELTIVAANEGIADNRNGIVIWPRVVAGEHIVSGLAGKSPVGRLFTIRSNATVKVQFSPEEREFAVESLFFKMALSGAAICVLPDIYCKTDFDTAITTNPQWISTNFSLFARSEVPFGAAMGLPVSSTDMKIPGSIFRVQADIKTPFQRILPIAEEPWGDPVSFSPDYNGVLVHPVKESLTVARISLPGRGIRASLLFVEIENANDQNEGFEAILLPGGFRDRDDFASMLDSNLPNDSYAVLDPETKRTLRLGVDRFALQTHFYLVTKSPPGKSPSNCHAIVRSYGAVV
ncbi:glycosyltransferase [Methylorubrum sp. GM97]|uniref:glycosyltransferase n=1 Tax=Methylorubrum sp. GM97 TaxID=2938232 RepID=UPI002185DF0C|nr:glycosyltransferase [Methylorubrum sp. GM97]BDL41098.1 hypothetical protein MSPGM_36880 [Methylorubrum sp. GM97]